MIAHTDRAVTRFSSRWRIPTGRVFRAGWCQARLVNDASGTVNGTRFEVTEAAHHGDERATLLGALQRQRDLVAWSSRAPRTTS